MKTREEIYGNEATALLRDVTMYHNLSEKQLLALYQDKDSIIKNLLTHLTKQGRIFYDNTNGCYSSNTKEKIDKGMSMAIWVLIDFISKVEYHSASDFPAKLIFFASGSVYEVIYVPLEQETLINHLWSHLVEEDPPRRIIIVDNPEQISAVNIPSVSGFCTVDVDGNIDYFKKE